ncbi:MAG TPA: DUF4157 domain-containing protein, partial [Candidatus Omnitrophota bacterium]|nr:DUF4157 domain-containing protein [Candidatus Omnitrophota bacterium]
MKHHAPPPTGFGAAAPHGQARAIQGYFPGGRMTIQAKTQGNATQLPNSFRLPAGGQPLPEAVRSKMEGFFKADFSRVRVHVGPE